MKSQETITQLAGTRRDALKSVVASTLLISLPGVVTPTIAEEVLATNSERIDTTDFVPENDYPYFGWYADAKSPDT